MTHVSRRRFLQLATASALAAACRTVLPVHPRAARAVAFDLFTLFDPRGVDRAVAAHVPGDAGAFATAWKTRLFEYSWIRATAGRYADFEQLARDSIGATAHARGVVLADRDADALVATFSELDPWPDTAAALHALRARGFVLAPLANFTPRMIDALLARARIDALFDARISTDAARTYKPDPRAYALAESVLGLPRAQIAFAAFGGWDAAGGRWFGFPTFHVNRLGLPDDALVEPDAAGPDLSALDAWLA